MRASDWLEAWPLLLGWPALFVACALTLCAIRRRKPGLSVLAMLFIAPASFYLAGSPIYGWIGIVVPIALLALSIGLAMSNGARRKNRASG